MKRCPKCSSTYTDDSLNFCLTDGAPLSSVADPDATLVMQTPVADLLLPKPPLKLASQQTTNVMVRYLIVGLLALIVGGGAVALFMWPNNSVGAKPDSTPPVSSVASPTSETHRPTPFTKRISVPANQMWFDTGIDITGKLVRIDYVSGQWRIAPTAGFNDGNGRRPFAGQRLLVVPEADLASLVGKTYDGAFFVGNSYEGRPGSGRLYLGVNDIPGEYSDNNGVLYVSVTLSE
jgi:hypothetical protein